MRSKASCGACIKIEIGLAKNTIIIHKIADIIVNKIVAPPIILPIFLCFLSPKYLLIKTVTPIASPLIMKVTKFNT